MVAVRWGFTGRAHELAAATELIVGTPTIPAVSVLIVGRRGTGKSRFAEDIIQRATRAKKDADDIVGIDDVEKLDPAASEGVSALIAVGRRVVMTTSSTASLPESIALLVDAGKVSVVTLRELTRSETTEMVAAALDGPLSGRLASALWRLSYGSVSVVTAVVDGSVAAGRIHRSSGTWDYVGDLDLSVLEVELSSRIRLLTGEQADALHTVALSEPIPLAVLNRVVSEPAIDYLCAAGFIDIAPLPGVGTSLFAALAPPAHGVLLRASVPAGHRREIVRRMLEFDIAGPHELVRPVAWALENGETVSLERAVRAAERANRFHDYRSSVQICTAVLSAVDARGDIIEDALLHRAVALRHLTRFDDAVADIERLRDLLAGTHSPPASVTWCERWSTMATAYADIIHGADLDCTAALTVIDECARQLDADGGHHGRHARRHLAALRVQHQAYAGRFVSALAEHDKLGRLPSPLRQRIDVITAVGLVGVGAARQASARVADALRQADTVPDAAWLIEELVGTRFLTTLRSEGPAAAMALAPAHSDTDRQALVRWDDGMRALAEAELRLAAGDIAGARRSAHDAVAIIEAEGPRDYLARALSLSAEAAAFSGEHATAARTSVRTMSTAGVANSIFAADIEVSLATVDVLGPAGDVRHAREVAARFAEQSLFGVAARLLHLAVRLGDRAAAEELAALTGALDGGLNTLYVEHARALSDQDCGALLGVGTQFLHRGFVLVAAETAEAARALGLAQAQEDMAAAAGRHAVMLHGLLDLDNIVTLRQLPVKADAPTLTRREQEIAALVASGMSNRDMASTLGVSVRTIEGHLARMYAKLGIPGRRGLQARVDSSR